MASTPSPSPSPQLPLSPSLSSPYPSPMHISSPSISAPAISSPLNSPSLNSPSISSPLVPGATTPRPSSSANTIQAPGRSILKKPPVPQQTFLQRMAGRFLPTQNQNEPGAAPSASDDARPSIRSPSHRALRRAHFILPAISTVYPISSANAPSSPSLPSSTSLKEEKKRIEEREKERRVRVIKGEVWNERERWERREVRRVGSVDSFGSSSLPPSSSSSSTVLDRSIGGSGARSTRSGSVSSLASSILPPPSLLGPDGKETEPRQEDDWWSLAKLESFYRECCAGAEEGVDERISRALLSITTTTSSTSTFTAGSTKSVGRTLTLTTIPLSGHSVHPQHNPSPFTAYILADVLSIEWGLRKLVLKACDLTPESLKPILHALLLVDKLEYLSVACNPSLSSPPPVTVVPVSSTNLSGSGSLLGVGGPKSDVPSKERAWPLLASYISRSTTLLFLDISENPISTKGLELLTEWGTGRVESLRVDGNVGGVGPRGLDVLARAVKRDPGPPRNNGSGTSTPLQADEGPDSPHGGIKHVSLRFNRIAPGGGVPLAVMLRDWPDWVGAVGGTPTLHSPTPSSAGIITPTPTSAAPSFAGIQSPPGTPNTPTFATKTGPLLPPPKHPAPQAAAAAGTTYTPYIPRSKRLAASAQPAGGVHTSTTRGGGVTSLSLADSNPGSQASSAVPSPTASPAPTSATPQSASANQGPSQSLLSSIRALSALPRTSSLLTLDLKGNELKTGVGYLSQVLKRNRTLKTLNLSECKINEQGLAGLGEGLKYNSCLETLDLSKNPCSGPDLVGIHSLRTAFTLNTSLKRLFLSSTHLSTSGAIALAEFLPESASLLHLSLTSNPQIELAGVLALSESIKGNWTMRCLDLDVNAGEEEWARCARGILGVCVRNTEVAAGTAPPPALQDMASRLTGGVVDTRLYEGGGGDVTSPASAKPRSAKDAAAVVGGTGRRVWNMIESSELAKQVRQDEEQRIIELSKVAAQQKGDALLLARSVITDMRNAVSAGAAPPGLQAQAEKALEEVSKELGEDGDVDPTRLEGLLEVNDEIREVLAILPAPSNPTVQPAGSYGMKNKPSLRLQGIAGMLWDPTRTLSPKSSLSSLSSLTRNGSGASTPNGTIHGLNGNGNGMMDSPTSFTSADGFIIGDDESPATPRRDKGKAKAPPPVEKVLTPTVESQLEYSSESEHSDASDTEDGHEAAEFPPFSPSYEGDEEELGIGLPGASPTDRSRSWVEEEGEVFRKGNVLLGPEEMEGEYAGDELRKELLEAMVERPPPRALDDLEAMSSPPMTPEPLEAVHAAPSISSALTSPNMPSSPSPPITPRPYTSRSRSSSNSTLSLVSAPSPLGSPSIGPGLTPTLEEIPGSATPKGAGSMTPTGGLLDGAGVYERRRRAGSAAT